MSTTATATFSTQILGETENALNAILDRQLAGTPLTEPRWVTLTVAVTSGGTVQRGALAARVAGGLKISHVDADGHIAALEDAGLVRAGAAEDSTVVVTDAGQQLHGRIRATVMEIIQRMWGDLPAEDLATAGRVLATILARANAELAAG
jgi:DNA-binding MarR family transcriptional regulator